MFALIIAGQRLTGNFSFEKSTIGCTQPCTPETVLKITASNVGLRLGDGVTDYVVVSNGSGVIIVRNAGPNPGLVAQIQATIAVNIPNVAVGGTFTLKLNTTGAAFGPQTLDLGELGDGQDLFTLDVPTGLVVSGNNVFLDTFGQHISGNFTFEQFTRTGPNNTQLKMIRLGISNLVINLGDGSTTFLSVTASQAVFVIGTFITTVSPAHPTGTVRGMAGSITASIAVGPGLQGQFEFSGDFQVQFNNTGVNIDETIPGFDPLKVAGNITFKVLGGDAVVAGHRVTLTIAGQEVSVKNLAIEQTVSRTGARIVSVGIEDLGLVIRSGSEEIFNIDGINGALVITPERSRRIPVDHRELPDPRLAT